MLRPLFITSVLVLAGCSVDGDLSRSGSTTTAPPVGTSTVAPDSEPDGGDVTAETERARRAARDTVEASRFRADLRTELDFDGTSIFVTASGWQDSERRLADLTFENRDAEAESVLHIATDGDSLWARGSAFDDLPDGKEWARSSDVLLQGGTGQTDGVLQALYGIEGTADWQTVADEVADDGTDVTVHETTTTYTALVEGAASLDKEAEFRAALNLTGPTEVVDLDLDLTVWIDADDRIHRFEIHSDSSVQAPIAVALTLLIDEFDAERDPPTPPADDITLEGAEADAFVRQAFAI